MFKDYLPIIISGLVALVSLWTAKNVSDIKVFILSTNKKEREESDTKYLTKEVFEAFQQSGHGRARARASTGD